MMIAYAKYFCNNVLQRGEGYEMLVETYLLSYNLCLQCWIKGDSDGVDGGVTETKDLALSSFYFI